MNILKSPLLLLLTKKMKRRLFIAHVSHQAASVLGWHVPVAPAFRSTQWRPRQACSPSICAVGGSGRTVFVPLNGAEQLTLF